MARRDEPFNRLVNRVIDLRKQASEDLCQGRWDTEGDARALVGQYRAMAIIIEEMRTIAGPGTNFGEEDI